MKRTLAFVTTGATLVVLLTACGPHDTTAVRSNEPTSESTPVRSTQPPGPPSDTARPTSGPYDTGEAVGESARELWEDTKEFGRGVIDGFKLDNKKGD